MQVREYTDEKARETPFASKVQYLPGHPDQGPPPPLRFAKKSSFARSTPPSSDRTAAGAEVASESANWADPVPPSPMTRTRLLLATALLFAGATGTSAQTAPYSALDNVEGEWVSTNAAPIRPMVLTADTLDLFAVSTQANTVVRFNGSGVTPFDTPRSPVSVALWDHDTMDMVDESRLLVVCRDSYALAVLDRLTGETLAVLELRDPGDGSILGEPQDLLVDQSADRAFVSCGAADAVAEIDLTTLTVVRVFEIPGKVPVFMAFDANDDVLVAPMLSGNNSGARKSADNLYHPQHQGPTVVDFETMALNGTKLPDEDLFRCVRSSGAVEAVTTDAGTLQFGVGVHPTTGAVWQLNTDANNKDPLRQGYRAIQGDVVKNQVSISTLPLVGAPPNTPTTIVDLDTTNLSYPYDPSRTVGQPYALEFVGNSVVAIAGLLTDNVMVLDQNGDFHDEFDLPDGSIPRGMLFMPSQNYLFVHCWGTNKVETYNVAATPTHAFTLDLGFDPTPVSVQAGRRLFYDAKNSAKNNASCASCHPEGRSDLVVWNLADTPTDDKGPMLTQTLAGIGKVAPFQWRGDLRNGPSEFNAAFVSVLGAQKPLSPSDFRKFESFTFSIQNAPNPFENEERVVDDAIQPKLFIGAPPSRATVGQTLFQSGCEECHNQPIGTNNNIVGSGNAFDEENPRRQRLRTGSFHDLYRREQDADPTTPEFDPIPITLASLTGGPDENLFYAMLGAANSHAGLSVGLHAFTQAFPEPPADLADLTGFLFQWDQGLAPATYRATLLDQTSHPTESLVLANYLVPQADARNCDIGVYGTSTLATVLTPMRWAYDRSQGLFVAEDTTVTSQPLSFFTNQAAIGEGSNVFVGVPVGMGVRFAVDYDGDDLFNADELALGTDPFNPDTDEDGWPDGHEVANGGNALNLAIGSNDVTDPVIARAVTQFVTGQVARINVETDEPCYVTVAYSYAGGPSGKEKSARFAKTSSVLLTDLLNSTGGSPWITYAGSVTVTDRAGRTSSVPLPNMPTFNLMLPGSPPAPLTTRSFKTSFKDLIVGDLDWYLRGFNKGGSGVRATANVRIERLTGGPPAIQAPDIHVIARIFKNNELVSNFLPIGGSRKLAGFDRLKTGTPQPFVGLSGPFLVSEISDSAGETQIGFSLRGLKKGDEIRLNIELLVEQDGAYSTFTAKSITRYVMPATDAENRGLKLRR